MRQETPHLPARRRDEATPSPNEQSGTPGLMTVVHAMLVGIPAAYAACHSVLITLITGAVAFGVVLLWRWIRLSPNPPKKIRKGDCTLEPLRDTY